MPYKTIFLIILLALVFVLPSLEFVNGGSAFVFYYFVWLFLAAWISCVDGGFQAIRNEVNAPKVTNLIDREKNKLVEKLTENSKQRLMSAKLLNDLNEEKLHSTVDAAKIRTLTLKCKKQESNLRKVDKKKARLLARTRKMDDRHLSLENESYNEVYSKCISSLQVVISAGFATVLPLYLITDISNVAGLTIPLPEVNFNGSAEASSLISFPGVNSLTVKSQLGFIFLVSALPLLLVGTLLPTYVGRGLGYPVARRFHWVGRFAYKIFGEFITPLKKLESRLSSSVRPKGSV